MFHSFLYEKIFSNPLKMNDTLFVLPSIAFIFALLCSLFIGKFFIQYVKKKQIGQYIREEGPASHLSKTGTPTMGGIIMIISTFLPIVLLAPLNHPFTLLFILSTFSFAMIGFTDDLIKIKTKKNLGFKAKHKFLCQIIFASISSYFLSQYSGSWVNIPFSQTKLELMTPGFILFSTFVIISWANAINLTDGLDGMVSTATVPPLMMLLLFANIAEASFFLPPAFLSSITNAEVLSILIGALIGACLGFLWFNAYPAKIFMGDTGSLFIGASLALLSLMVKQSFLFILTGFIFVLEISSVVLQVGYFKLTKGKRLFKMSPLHHHFELSGIPENKVVMQFFILSSLFSVFSLILLKLYH